MIYNNYKYDLLCETLRVQSVSRLKYNWHFALKLDIWLIKLNKNAYKQPN